MLSHAQNERWVAARAGQSNHLVLLVVLALGAVLLAIAAGAGSDDESTAGAARPTAIHELPQRQLLARINETRRARGLRTLTLSAQLDRAADARARSMARRGYFAHTTPDGTPYWKVIARYYPLRGFDLWSVGENLLWSAASVESKEIVDQWLGSPRHAANLLDRRWSQIGTGTLVVQNAPGVFGHRDVTIVVADFGVRILRSGSQQR